eukprot:evm.model.scf_468.11 EVM.evm.TU.scf_468.11   scf_468:68530-70909(+)
MLVSHNASGVEIHLYSGRPGVLSSIEALEKKIFPKAASWAGRIEKEVKRRNTSLLYAVNPGDEVVGYVIFTVVSAAAHISKLAVKAEWRRQGIGLSLLQAALKRAGSTRQATHSTLHVAADNTAALCLYSCAGYHKQALLEDYYHEGRHAYHMTADL